MQLGVSDDFGVKVDKKINDLSMNNLRALETAAIEKRLRWCRDNLAIPEGGHHYPTVGIRDLSFEIPGIERE